MASDIPQFMDNTRVFLGRQHREFLTIQYNQPDAAKDIDFFVYIYRYGLPGRYDIYSFQLGAKHPNELRYFSDCETTLPQALKLAAKDFDRPNVIEMVVNAFQPERVMLHYGHYMLRLLKMVAPKSKTLRKLRAMNDTFRDKRRVEFEAREAKRANEGKAP